MISNYFQYAFSIDENNQLFINNKISLLEKSIPEIYESYHKKLKTKNSLQEYEQVYLNDFFHFTFSSESSYQEIFYCSSPTREKAFNLFHEYYYYLRKNDIPWTEEDVVFITDVVAFEEEYLLSDKNIPFYIDIGTKGLVKSELYKSQNYRFCHQKQKGQD